jgi:signal transduction histidine kinase
VQPIDPTILTLLLLGVPYLVIIGVSLRAASLRTPKEQFLVLTAALSLLATVGHIVLRFERFVLLLDPILERALLYGAPLLMVAFLGLTRTFLRLGGIEPFWLALSGVWIASLVTLHEDLLNLPEKMWIGLAWTFERPLLTPIVGAVGWGLLLLRIAFLTLRTYRQTRRPLHRNRLRFWILVVTVHATTGGLVFAGRGLFANGLHVVGLGVAAYVVLTHDLPDIVHTMRQMLCYLIVTLAIAALYSGGFVAARTLFGAWPGYSPVLAAGGVALVLAAFIGPLLSGARRLTSRLISGRSYDPAGTLREYSTRISNILDLEELAVVAIGLIGEAMHVRRGALLVVHPLSDDGESGSGGQGDGAKRVRFRGVMGIGEGPLPPHVTSAESPIVRWLNHEHRPLTQYDVDLLPCFDELPPDDRRWLDDLDMDVFVPIYAQGEWIGLLAVGPKASGARYFEEDLTVLSTLADQTAVALENARLFADLKRQNAENQRLNDELIAANRELARLDQAKSDFIDIASHELRTPLTQVRGYNDILDEMLSRGSLTAEAGLEMTAGVRNAARRLEEIVDTMFDVSRLDSETMDIAKSPVAIGSIVRIVLKEWEKAFRERDLTVSARNLTGLPMIVADSEGVRRVLSNLIQNAIKYTPDGGAIHVEGRAIGLDGPRGEQAVEIVVRDTGVGIEPENLDRIFDKFYRVGSVMRHSTGRTKFMGAGPGLGLAIARGIVQAHGGRMWAVSPGRDEERCPGAEFHVLLPVEAQM